MSSKGKKGKSTGVTYRLNEPGMGEHERAGLAGLCLSLSAARAWENQRRAWPLPNAFGKNLDALRETISNLNAPDFPVVEDGLGVRLEWPEGEEKAALNAVVKWAWQVHEGVLFLPGVHRKREHLDCYYLRLPAHNGLLGTFFQFPRTIKKVKDPERKVVRFDEERTFSVSYRRIASDAKLPQHNAVPNKGVCDDALASPMASWIYPGSEPRFNNNTPPSIRRETGWRGPARFAYLMLFAPIACHYFKLPRTNAHNWAYMVPGVENLREHQREFLRRNRVNFGNWPFYGEVAGLEDAALRYTTRNKARGRSVTVVMGKADFYHAQQKTRKNLWRDIAVSDNMQEVFRRYDIFNRVFPVGNMARPTREAKAEESDEKGNHFIALPNCRERITANILRGSPWYADLAYIPFWQRDRAENDCHEVRKRGLRAVGLNLPWKSGDQGKESISPERLWFLKLHHFEREQLMLLTKKEVWDDPLEKDLLYAFREAFRRLLNREHKAIGRGGSRELPKRWDNTADKWYRRLLHAKTGLLLSNVVHELLAQAARSPNLRDGSFVVPGGPAFLLFKTSEDESDESRHARNDAFHAKFRHMVNDPSDWKKVRDLTLLALTTFTDKRLGQRKDSQSTGDNGKKTDQ